MSVSKHEEKMVTLQQQLRQNQTDLQSYLADLTGWEAEIKEKEENLKSQSVSQKVSGDNLPPVRNTLHKKKLKKKKKDVPVKKDKPQRLSGFDFQAWDKFDVEKALEEVDSKHTTENGKTSSSEYETDEEWELERKQHLASVQKDQGNDFFKKGDYDMAIEAYTKGMELDKTNKVLPANRALILLKQQKFAAAELDCTTSISLDPLYVKAYLRRATARASMGKLDEALSDYNRVLDLEPTNKQAKTELERMQKEVKRDETGTITTTFNEDKSGIVKPIYKPLEERSRKPLVRIPIEEIGLEATSRPVPRSEQSEITKKITVKEKEAFDKLFISSNRSEKISKPLSDSESPVQESSQQTNSEGKVKEFSSFSISSKGGEQDTSAKNLPQTRTSLSKLPGKTHEPEDSKPRMNLPEAVTSSLDLRESSDSSLRPVSNMAGCSSSVDSVSIPQTSFQFQTDFKQLKKNPEAFAHYFQAISPERYPRLLGQSLDADILTTILTTLALSPNRINLYDILLGLTRVKRFSMAAMFLSKRDKEEAKRLIQEIKESGTRSDDELSALIHSYNL